MKICIDGKVISARLTSDCPNGTRDGKLKILLEDGRSFKSADEIEEAGLQFVQTSALEYECLLKKAFLQV
jgi:hypothetical protein